MNQITNNDLTQVIISALKQISLKLGIVRVDSSKVRSVVLKENLHIGIVSI